MAVKEVRFSSDARARVLRGVDLLADAVKLTLGPRGRNVVMASSFGPPRISKDGVSVAREIELADRFENMGAQMMREVATKTSELAGDGTTTAVVLAQAIAHEGVKAVVGGIDPMELKRGIDAAVAAAIEDIKQRSRKVETTDEIAQVATISANGVREIGNMVAEAMDKVGHEGVVTVEEAKSLTSELEIVEGTRFDRGYLSPYSSPMRRRWCASWRSLLDRLADFLKTLPKRWQYAFDFRDESWFDPRAYELLAVHKAALCLYDYGGRQAPLEVTADFVYIRLHGPGAPYQGSYSDEALAMWARRMLSRRAQGISVYGYFDNDEQGYAPANALTLAHLVAAGSDDDSSRADVKGFQKPVPA